jgi:hypothetical protein
MISLNKILDLFGVIWTFFATNDNTSNGASLPTMYFLDSFKMWRGCLSSPHCALSPKAKGGIKKTYNHNAFDNFWYGHVHIFLNYNEKGWLTNNKTKHMLKNVKCIFRN